MAESFQMKLKCIFNLSKEADNAKDDLAKFVKEANEAILVKGAPKGLAEKAAKISSWELRGSKLSLMIESGPHVRATAAVLRIKKALGSVLGEKYKVGIRGVNVTEFIVLIPTAQPPSKNMLEKIRAIPNVQEAKIEAAQLTVVFKPMTDLELKRNIPDRVLTLVSKELEEATKPVPVPAVAVQVLRQSPPKPIKFKEEPMKVAAQIGWIKEFPGRGQWIYTPPYTRLLEAIESILLDEVVKKLEFEPFMLPKLIPLEVMKHMPGYLDGIPEGMYYVCPPPRDPEAFAKFKEQFKVTKEVPKEELKQVIRDPEYVLAPAQCEPFWHFFFHEVLNVEDLPFKFYDRSGWTYRWEGGGVEGLVRLQEFRRIELVYYGRPDDVVEIRDNILNETVRTAGKTLDLEWRIVPGIPFFARAGEAQIDIRDSRNVPAYDVEIYLPYRGPRETVEWLEVTACFVHKTKFIDAFKIREVKSKDLWSGCTGMGISRWVAAFLAEHGFDVDKWPKAVRDRFGKYKLPRTLTWPLKR